MKIDIPSQFVLPPNSTTKQNNNTNSFTDHLANSIAPGRSAERPNSLRDELAEFKEKGFIRYIYEERVARIREQLLDDMGISEEELAAMPLERRQKIEELIAQEIQRRLAAESALDNNKDNNRLKLSLPNSPQSMALQGGLNNSLPGMETVMEKHMAQMTLASRPKTTIERLETLLDKDN